MKFRVILIFMVVFCTAGGLLSAVAGNMAEREIIKPEEDGVVLRSVLPTPVYSTSEIPALYYDDSTNRPRVKTDDKGHIRELEYIAFEGSKFVHRNTIKVGDAYIYEVLTDDYSSSSPLYIDSSFVVRSSGSDSDRDKSMPDKSEILTVMRGMIGVPYRWGGNYHKGIPEQLDFYPVGDVDIPEGFFKMNRSVWTLEGVDCSGLLYEAANGATPRNTSGLVGYGKPVDIEGLGVEQIAAKVRPLDIIVWKGHVVIVLDSDNVIESRPRYPDGHKGGVRVLPLKERLADIMSRRKPVNSYDTDTAGEKRFVVRRFIK